MRPRWILVICAVVSLGIVGYALWSPSGATRARAQDKELSALSADVKALQENNDALRQEAERLRGDSPETKPYLEQAVREELGYVRPDERVVLTGASAPAIPPGKGEETAP